MTKGGVLRLLAVILTLQRPGPSSKLEIAELSGSGAYDVVKIEDAQRLLDEDIRRIEAGLLEVVAMVRRLAVGCQHWSVLIWRRVLPTPRRIKKYELFWLRRGRRSVWTTQLQAEGGKHYGISHGERVKTCSLIRTLVTCCASGGIAT